MEGGEVVRQKRREGKGRSTGIAGTTQNTACFEA